MITDLFILGGVAFWILSGVIFLLLLWAASDDRALASGLLLAGYLAAVYLFGNASILAPEPWIFYIGIPSYLAVGALWGIGKWYLFVSRQVMSYKEQRQEFLIGMGIERATMDSSVPIELKAMWRLKCGFHKRPVVRYHKRRIISWMCFWPTSILWAVIDEPWRRIYSIITVLLQRIVDSIYENAGVDEDLRDPAV